jgi:NAD(P)-dependent dehydrogenase (short-subunit alcohol dehydrogenase family)
MVLSDRRAASVAHVTRAMFMGLLDNKTAVFTGAAQGIGRTIVETFAREGAAVVIGDVNLDATEQAAAELVAGGSRALTIRCDAMRCDVGVRGPRSEVGGRRSR